MQMMDNFHTIVIFRNGRFNFVTVQYLVDISQIVFSINLKLSGLNHRKHMGTQ